MQKSTEFKNKLFVYQTSRDFDEISENFDLALSLEVIRWFNEQNGNVLAKKKALKRLDLDEYELSLI